MSPIRFFLYGVPAILLLLLTVSFWNTKALSAKKKNEMSLGLLAEPPCLNPLQQADTASGPVMALLYNGLLKQNEKLELVGDLAQEWSISDTKTEPIIKFTLRKNVRWHDGTPFTSRDVLFTYHAIMDERLVSPLRGDFEKIATIEAPDPWHIIIRYRVPFSPALLSWTTAILPAHLLEGTNPVSWASSFNRHPIGTGPFRFESWKSNEYVRLKRNDDYFLGAPWLDSMVFHIFPDPLTMRLAFETNQIDFWDAPPSAIKSFSNDSRYELFDSPSNMYTYLGWNLRRAMFSDRSVRQALAQAVNIPEMIRYILYGHGVVSTGIYTPQLWFFNPNVVPFSYNPEQSKKLLDAAGWKVGPDGIRQRHGKRFSFTIITNNGNDVRKDIATLVQDDLNKIGIEVKIEIYEWAVFLKKVKVGDFDATALGWALPNNYDQYQIWHSSQCHPDEMNYVGYQNPRADALLLQLEAEYDHTKIIQLAGELQQIIYQDQPYLFLFVPQSTSVLQRGSYRICYPTDHGFIDSPIHMTKAGWSYNLEWFYRTGYPPKKIKN